MIKIGGDHTRLFGFWQDILDSGHFTEGRYVRMLEEKVSEWYGMDAIAVNSAGTGLYAILASLDLLRGRPIAVCNNTFYATGGMAAEIAGHDSVQLIDADRGDFCMDYNRLVREYDRLNPYQAVILTQVGGGLSRNYDRIAGVCEGINCPLVEDAAHALGVRRKDGSTAGTHSKAAVFSLYPTKAIPAGDGGIIVTRDPDLAERIRRYRNYGKYRDDSGALRYSHFGGFNFRMDEWTAAVALHQWLRLGELLERRAEAARKLSRVVKPLIDWDGDSNWYKFIVPAEFGAVRRTGQVYANGDQLRQSMHYNGDFPNSDWIAHNHVCLPLDEDLYDGMSSDEIEAWLLGAENNPNARSAQ